MKIELKKIKRAAFASEETDCFEATIYIDGVKAGTVSNDGHGGCNSYHPWSIAVRINAFAKTLPPITTEFTDPNDKSSAFSYEPDADTVVNEVLTRELCRKDLRRALKSKVLFTKVGAKGVYSTRKLTAVEMAKVLANPSMLKGADKVLNSLPEDEALVLYTAS